MHPVLDHVFILVKPDNQVAEKLRQIGLYEGKSRIHQGQGTSNNRFLLSNGMLELLWVHDVLETQTGPAKGLRFSERSTDPEASPFGLVFRNEDDDVQSVPYKGWSYQPDYFPAPVAFHIGENASRLSEPLCIYMPYRFEGDKEHAKALHRLTNVKVDVMSDTQSGVLETIRSFDRLDIETGSGHLLTVELDAHQAGHSFDFRPNTPLILKW